MANSSVKKIWVTQWFVISALAILPMGSAKVTAQPAAGLPLFEQFQREYREVHLVITSTTVPNPVKPGGRFHLYVQVHLPQGWHIYSMQNREDTLPTRIRLEDIPFMPQGGWKESPPQMAMDGVLQEMIQAHEKTAEFTLALQTPEDLRSGPYLISGILTYRLCDNKVCFLPRELPFQTRVQVAFKGE